MWSPLADPAGLGEHRTRDLNDEINKLMREKTYWERQIKALGGVDYSTSRSRIGDGGKELPGGHGYRYFGAAKDLPGVRELFDAVRPCHCCRKCVSVCFMCRVM